MATNRINARQNWQLGFFYAPVKIFFGFSQTRSALHAMGTCRTPCYMLHGLEGLIRTYTNQTLLLYCIRTLPRREINWEILPPRTKRFPKSRDFAPRGPRDCPRAILRAEGCKIPTRGKSRGPRWVYFPMHPDSRQCTDILSELAGKY